MTMLQDSIHEQATQVGVGKRVDGFKEQGSRHQEREKSYILAYLRIVSAVFLLFFGTYIRPQAIPDLGVIWALPGKFSLSIYVS